jgi:Amidohydrolase family
MDLLLKNLSWHDGIENQKADVRIKKQLIDEIGECLQSKKSERVIDFQNHFIYPGLINAHDHLEMNLYPKLGNPPYHNYVEWMNDIYRPMHSPILEIEKVNIKDRLIWGGFKNLVSAVTTVVHHNPWRRILGKTEFPVRVLKNFTWAHSLHIEKDVLKKISKDSKTPFIIDEFAFLEIEKMQRLGLLKSNTVIVHAIGLKKNDIETLVANQSSVVWCPSSNLFMFESTAPIQKLKSRINVGIGSDSTLTGEATFLGEIKAAAKTNLVKSNEIFEMTTSIAAKIFNLPQPKVATLSQADLFITPIKKENYFENLLVINSSDITLLLLNGEPRLVDSKIEGINRSTKNQFHMHGQIKYTDVDIVSLKKRIEKQVGNKILQQNPLWNLIEI